VVGSRVAGGHRGATRSALDAARSRADTPARLVQSEVADLGADCLGHRSGIVPLRELPEPVPGPVAALIRQLEA